METNSVADDAVELVTGKAAGKGDQAELEALVLAEGDVPRHVLIAPWGEVNSAVGSFVVDAEGAGAVIASFVEHGTDIPIDYEHQTLGGAYASPNGQAPAAGWIKSLRAVTPEEALSDAERPAAGLWAEVEWTPLAAEQLRGRQYRYLSPVALVRREDRRITGLHSAALTNKPAIIGMRPVINSTSVVNEPSRAPDPGIQTLREALGMDGAASDDVVIVAAATRIHALETAAGLEAARQRVARAAAAGKLAATQQDWAMALALRDPVEFDAWERTAPCVVPMGRLSTQPRGHPRVINESSAAAMARAEWRANRALLEPLCSEEAFVADAVRQVN